MLRFFELPVELANPQHCPTHAGPSCVPGPPSGGYPIRCGPTRERRKASQAVNTGLNERSCEMFEITHEVLPHEVGKDVPQPRFIRLPLVIPAMLVTPA